MVPSISLLGSTGSIGRQTLEVCARLGVRVEALTARRNIDLLERQARQFRPRLVVLWEREDALALKERLSDLNIRAAWGMEGLLEAASLPESDTVVTAVVGMVGLKPTLAAIREGEAACGPLWRPSRRANASPWPTRRPWSAPGSW